MAAAAAERAMGILELTGRSSSIATAREVLDILWSAAAEGRDPDDAQLGRRIDRLPEAHVIEAEWPADVAQGALETIWAAALATSPSIDVNADIREVAESNLSSFDAMDWVLAGGGPRIIDPRNPPPPGEWEAAEAARFRRDEATALSSLPLDELAKRLRTTALEDRGRLVERMRPLVSRSPRRGSS